MGHQIDYEKLVADFLIIVVITSLVNNFVSKKWFGLSPLVRIMWSYFVIEQVQFYGPCLLYCVNNIEHHFQGEFFMCIMMLFWEIHYYLAGDWLEDLIFGDLDMNYGNKGVGRFFSDNWPAYICQVISLPVCAAI